ncbi:MAG: 50S ribosomal protein L30 [Gemmatimonadetes bacterium]|nr:50S ribosomal protein L30 [Gemmatimonadota bacterium]
MPRKKAAEAAGAAQKSRKAAKAAKVPKARARSRAGAGGESERQEGHLEPLVGKLRVKQVRSGIGHAYTYRRTLAALGLRHHQAEVLVADTPSVRGMLFKVAHLVRVRPEEA